MLGFLALFCLVFGILFVLLHDLLPVLDSRRKSPNNNKWAFIRSYGGLLAYTLLTTAVILGLALLLSDFNIRV